MPMLFIRIVKGAVGARSQVKLFSANTSARFPMDAGATYLLFIRDGKGEPYVDNCGWSGKVTSRETYAILHRVRALAKTNPVR
jgi:hypothetical protein